MADELSDQEVENLIRIIVTDLKERKGHWYTLGIPINHYYTLDDKIDAIKQLGLSKNELALKYIRKLSVHEEVENGRNSDWNGYGDPAYDIIYPNAHGELKEVLESRMMGGLITSAEYDYKSGHFKAEYALSNALSQLEKAVKSNS